MEDMKMIRGESILAMLSDNTSIKEMLQLMGVDPTDEIVNEATTNFISTGNVITMEALYNFLKGKQILSKDNKENVKIASVVDLR